MGSSPVASGLFLERYKTFDAGVWGELITCYLTDSINFRNKIGSYDEHEWLNVEVNGNKITVFNFQTLSIPDTIEKKIIPKTELWKQHHSDTNCLVTVPVFGKNTIKCDNDFYPASGYKTDEGYYMSQVQYRCGTDYSNAVFYTDSLHFSIFIGVYIPGSDSNNYSVKVDKDSIFEFYNIEFKNKIDTVKSETFLLTDMRKGTLTNVCK